MMSEEKEHVISESEKDNWRRGKDRKRSTPPELTRDQKYTFVKLASRDSSSGTFERQLDMSRRDVNYYRIQFDILTTEDARKLLRKLNIENERRESEELNEQRREAAQARQIAEAKLDELDKKKAKEAEEARLERLQGLSEKQVTLKNEDAERQRLFADQEAKVKVETDWRLPIQSRDGDEEMIRFRNDITYRGMKFTKQKYGITDNDIKSEASRLGLKIRWDLVRP